VRNQRHLKIFLILFLSLIFCSENSFAKAGHTENLDLLREKEASQSKKYSFEVNEGGVYLEPQIRSVVGDNTIGDTSGVNNGQGDNLNYQVNSNIGVEFNKYFTGFLAYDFGNIGFDAKNQDINFDLDASTIKVNGFGSKINFSQDFYLKMMYIEHDLDYSGQQNTDIDKDKEFQLKGVVNF